MVHDILDDLSKLRRGILQMKKTLRLVYTCSSRVFVLITCQLTVTHTTSDLYFGLPTHAHQETEWVDIVNDLMSTLTSGSKFSMFYFSFLSDEISNPTSIAHVYTLSRNIDSA